MNDQSSGSTVLFPWKFWQPRSDRLAVACEAGDLPEVQRWLAKLTVEEIVKRDDDGHSVLMKTDQKGHAVVWTISPVDRPNLNGDTVWSLGRQSNNSNVQTFLMAQETDTLNRVAYPESSDMPSLFSKKSESSRPRL